MSEGTEIIVDKVKDVKPKKRATTEDKLKVLLDEQYARIEQMVDQKLDHSQYRMYNSFKAEMRRWWRGYYDNFIMVNNRKP